MFIDAAPVAMHRRWIFAKTALYCDVDALLRSTCKRLRHEADRVSGRGSPPFYATHPDRPGFGKARRS